SHFSRGPSLTTALPSWCTCNMSRVAFSREYPNSFWNTKTTYDMRFTGSFQTTTIHGLSVTVTSSTSGSWTSSGAVVMMARSRSLILYVLGDARQQAVDEPPRVLRGVLLRELDCFVDDDSRRELRFPSELVRADAQQCAVDRGHAVDGPVLRIPREQRVDLVAVLVHASHEHDRVRIRRRRLLVEHLLGAQAASLDLVAESKGSFPCLTPRGHRGSGHVRPARGTRPCGCRP